MKKAKHIKISTGGAIFYSLLLAATTFYSGVSWVKSKSGSANSGTTPTTSTTASVTLAVNKSDRPELKFFVMSFCPYGNQMEDILRPVFDLIDSKANLQPQYIFTKISDLGSYCKSRAPNVDQCETYIKNPQAPFKTIPECKRYIDDEVKSCLDEKQYLKAGNSFYASLHGRIEANQDIREICAWNLTADKKAWWDFIGNVNKNCNAQNADTCWKQQAQTAGLDTNKISDCFSKQAVELIEKEIAQTEKFQVSGSPTLLVNDTLFPPQNAYSQDGNGSFKIGNKVIPQSQYRTPNGIKDIVCAAFKNTPKECNQTLADLTGNNAPAAGGAGCGN